MGRAGVTKAISDNRSHGADSVGGVGSSCTSVGDNPRRWMFINVLDVARTNVGCAKQNHHVKIGKKSRDIINYCDDSIRQGKIMSVK